MVRIFRTTDLQDIYRIEKQNVDDQIFTKKELKQLIDSPTTQCYVAEEGIDVVGYMLYTWTKKYYNIVTVKVLMEHAGKPHREELLDKIKNRLVDCGRNRIVFYVSENDSYTSNLLIRNRFRAFSLSDGYICFKYCLAFDYKYKDNENVQ